jgi:hypothetical protein
MKFHGHFASSATSLTKIWSLCQNISDLQITQSSPKNPKTIDFKSTVIPLLGLQFRQFFFKPRYFFKRKSYLHLVSSNYALKFLEIDFMSATLFFPLKNLQKRKKQFFPFLAQERALIPIVM